MSGEPTRPEPVFAPPPEPVPFTPDPGAVLQRGAEVLVIGAGMVGASVAYHLARAGVRPLVIDAGSPAGGASGRNAGMALAGLGGHFPRVTALVQRAGGRSILDYTTRSLDMLEAWEAELPGGIEWDRHGSLDVATDDREEAHLRALASAQASEGLDVRVLAVDEVAEVAPSLNRDVVRAGAWTPGNATLNPFRLTYGLIDAARAFGGEIVTGVRVDRLLARSGRVSGVTTSHGEVEAGAVVIAANAWTPALVPHLAQNLTPIRETVCVTEMLDLSIGRLGYETNQCNEYWRQMRTGEVVIGGYAVADEGMGIGSYSVTVRAQPPAMLARLLGRMHPALADARIIRCWAGLLDFASLEIPMAGPLPADDGTPVPGGYVVCGLTGHGHPYAPILGLLISELVRGSTPTLPVEPFDPRRYVGARHDPTWLDPFGGTVSPAEASTPQAAG